MIFNSVSITFPRIAPWLPVVAGLLVACSPKTNENSEVFHLGSYGYDREFLNRHLSDITELRDGDGASVLVSGDLQGRVMTSTAGGDRGASLGWINYDLIGSGQKLPQFNPTGGEERFWIGPEGGQYSFYFRKGDSFEFKNWQVPAFIDTIGYQAVSTSSREVIYRYRTSLENYQGFRFDLDIYRAIRLLTPDILKSRLGSNLSETLKWVAYETENTVANAGQQPWKRETGLLSVWLLGMFNPSPETVAIIPIRNLPDANAHITDDYFGRIPAERLVRKDSVLLFRCDGNKRSKLGLSPQIAKPVAGSFDFGRNILTFILFEVHPQADYVNSKWELQQNPYQGDAVNAYNDGPLEDGTQMGPFYELESSSPALPLKPGEKLVYKQVTAHFEGEFEALNQLSLSLLGIDLNEARLP